MLYIVLFYPFKSGFHRFVPNKSNPKEPLSGLPLKFNASLTTDAFQQETVHIVGSMTSYRYLPRFSGVFELAVVSGFLRELYPTVLFQDSEDVPHF